MMQREMAITSDVAGQLLTKKYRKEKIFGKPDPINPLKAPGSVCNGQLHLDLFPVRSMLACT